VARKRIGELLIEQGAINQQQLAEGLAYQREAGGRLGNALVAQGYLTEEALSKALSVALGLPVMEIPTMMDWNALHLLRASFCESHELFPLHLAETRGGRKQLTLAMADPLNLPAIEEIEFTTGCKVQPVLASRSQIRKAILRHYHRQNIDMRPAIPDDSRMMVVRPGGGSEMVDTQSGMKSPFAQKAQTAEQPVDDEPIVPLTDEVAQTDVVGERRFQPRAGSTKAVSFLPAGDGEEERLLQIERRFAALIRLMSEKGIISKEELLDALLGSIQ
jgi:hypothetical protein